MNTELKVEIIKFIESIVVFFNEIPLPLANKTPLEIFALIAWLLIMVMLLPKIIEWFVVGQYRYLCNDIKLQCPHCNRWQGGFIGSPIGGTFYCQSDSCGKPYCVHSDADIEQNNEVKRDFIKKLRERDTLEPEIED